MTLLILLTASVIVGAGIGLTARMPVRELAAMCVLLVLTSLVFYGLVGLA